MVLDKDRDGILSSEEIKGAAEALGSLDRNGDGVLSRRELRPPLPTEPPPPRGAGRGPNAGGPRGFRREEDGERIPPRDSAVGVESRRGVERPPFDGPPPPPPGGERRSGFAERSGPREGGFAPGRRPGGPPRGRANDRRIPPPRGFAPEDGPPPPPPPDVLLSALDKDEDGTLSAEEIKGAASVLRSLDRNSDGALSRGELRPEDGEDRRPPGPRRGGPPPHRGGPPPTGADGPESPEDDDPTGSADAS